MRLYTKALLCSGQITFPETDFFVTLHLMNVLETRYLVGMRSVLQRNFVQFRRGVLSKGLYVETVFRLVDFSESRCEVEAGLLFTGFLLLLLKS